MTERPLPYEGLTGERFLDLTRVILAVDAESGGLPLNKDEIVNRSGLSAVNLDDFGSRYGSRQRKGAVENVLLLLVDAGLAVPAAEKGRYTLTDEARALFTQDARAAMVAYARRWWFADPSAQVEPPAAVRALLDYFGVTTGETPLEGAWSPPLQPEHAHGSHAVDDPEGGDLTPSQLEPAFDWGASSAGDVPPLTDSADQPEPAGAPMQTGEVELAASIVVPLEEPPSAASSKKPDDIPGAEEKSPFRAAFAARLGQRLAQGESGVAPGSKRRLSPFEPQPASSSEPAAQPEEPEAPAPASPDPLIPPPTLPEAGAAPAFGLGRRGAFDTTPRPAPPGSTHLNRLERARQQQADQTEPETPPSPPGRATREVPAKPTLDSFRRSAGPAPDEPHVGRRLTMRDDNRVYGPRSQPRAAQPPAAQQPPIIVLVLADNSRVEITQEFLDQWKEEHRLSTEDALAALRDIFLAQKDKKDESE